MQEEDIDDLLVASVDHSNYAANVHKHVLDIGDHQSHDPQLHETQPAHHHPPKGCCHLCWRRSAKITLAYILIFDIFLSLIHFCLWYFIAGYGFFRVTAFDESIITLDGSDSFVFLNYEETTEVLSLHTTQEYTDQEIEDKKFQSKYAREISGDFIFIESKCGEEYYRDFLIGDHITDTRELFQSALKLAKDIEIVYIAFDVVYLLLMGLCDKGSGGKIALLLCWMVQFPPFFMYIQFLLMANSKRFCILEYGFNFRPQALGTVYILCVIILYKFLILLRASTNYIYAIAHEKLFTSFNDSENDYMDMPHTNYTKFFSEKEYKDVKNTYATEPGTFRLIPQELSFGIQNAPTGNVLPSLQTSTETSISYKSDTTFTSTQGPSLKY